MRTHVRWLVNVAWGVFLGYGSAMTYVVSATSGDRKIQFTVDTESERVTLSQLIGMDGEWNVAATVVKSVPVVVPKPAEPETAED